MAGPLSAARVHTLGSFDKTVQARHCKYMGNITVRSTDETYRRARMKAAERDTSVSALVRRFLIDLDSDASEIERLKLEERALRERIVDFDASDRLSRDEIHRRPLPDQTSP